MRRPRHSKPGRGLSSALALAVLVLSAGCDSGSTPPASPAPPATAPVSSPATSPTPVSTPSPSPTDEEPEALDMALDEGSAIVVAGTDGNGDIDPANPARVSFSDSSCDDEFKDLGTDPDGRVRDVEADKNKQLCLFEFAVTNVGARPIKWTAEETASLIASNDEEYLISDTRWSAGAAADEAGKRYAGDGDLIARGKTEYDYVLFEIPDDVEPVKLRFLV